MTHWAAINYRDFWDVPRIFFVQVHGQSFLFDCQFDDSTEDFSDHYDVFAMPPLTLAEIEGPWRSIFQRSTRHLGRVPIDAITFDPTKRKQIDAAVLDDLLAGVARASG